MSERVGRGYIMVCWKFRVDYRTDYGNVVCLCEGGEESCEVLRGVSQVLDNCGQTETGAFILPTSRALTCRPLSTSPWRKYSGNTTTSAFPW
jgi:hypothetical protein